MASPFSVMYMIPKGLYEAFLSKSNEGNIRHIRQINNLDVNSGGKVTIRNDDTTKSYSAPKSSAKVNEDTAGVGGVGGGDAPEPSVAPLVLSGVASDVLQPSVPEQGEDRSGPSFQDRASTPIHTEAQQVGVQATPVVQNVGVQAFPLLQDAETQVNQPVQDAIVQAIPEMRSVSSQTSNSENQRHRATQVNNHPTALIPEEASSFEPMNYTSTKKTINPEANKRIRRNNRIFQTSRARNALQRRNLLLDNGDEDTVMAGPRIIEVHEDDNVPSSALSWLHDERENGSEDLFTSKDSQIRPRARSRKITQLDQRRQTRRTQPTARPLALNFQPNVSVSVPQNIREMVNLIARKGSTSSITPSLPTRTNVSLLPETRRKKGIRAIMKSNSEKKDSDQWITLGKRKSDKIKLNEKVEPPVKYALFHDE